MSNLLEAAKAAWTTYNDNNAYADVNFQVHDAMVALREAIAAAERTTEQWADRYKVVRAGYWWRIKIGDGDALYGKFFSRHAAETMAAMLLHAFRNGEFVATERTTTQKGCRCDAGGPDECVFDNGEPIEMCSRALQLRADGKGRDDCQHWKPIMKAERTTPPPSGWRELPHTEGYNWGVPVQYIAVSDLERLEALDRMAENERKTGLDDWAKVPQKERPDFIAGYDAGLSDGKRMVVAEAQPQTQYAHELEKLEEEARHPDSIAIDRFAFAMKQKMARQREKGYRGWDDKTDCPPGRLQRLLVEHLAKGDPVDVGNFAMMIFNRGESTKETE